MLLWKVLITLAVLDCPSDYETRGDQDKKYYREAEPGRMATAKGCRGIGLARRPDHTGFYRLGASPTACQGTISCQGCLPAENYQESLGTCARMPRFGAETGLGAHGAHQR